jgi:hypothetical protein
VLLEPEARSQDPPERHPAWIDLDWIREG